MPKITKKKKSLKLNDLTSPSEFFLWKGLYFLKYFGDFCSVVGTHPSIAPLARTFVHFANSDKSKGTLRAPFGELGWYGLCVCINNPTSPRSWKGSLNYVHSPLSITRAGESAYEHSAFSIPAEKLRNKLEASGFHTSSANVLLQLSITQYNQLIETINSDSNIDHIFKWIDSIEGVVPQIAWTKKDLDEDKSETAKLKETQLKSKFRTSPAGAPGKRRTVSRSGNTLRKTISLEESLAEAVKNYAEAKGLSDSSAINDLLRENNKLAPFRPKPKK